MAICQSWKTVKDWRASSTPKRGSHKLRIQSNAVLWEEPLTFQEKLEI